ncbi:HAD hydrolase family protein [Candidatus Peregrinibacteria bacterium]|nr:HAD hydrolase family protein [Candidatus Peregrinibacteria bacterium]
MRNKHKLFLKALEKTYCAAMFDFDGTLTERKPKSPVPDSLKETLRNLSRRVPMAICTARPFSTAYPKLQEILGNAGIEIVSNWALIAENGCAGYRFDQKAADWIEFYRIEWPEDKVARFKFAADINKNLHKHVRILQINPTNVIVQPFYENAADEEISRRCDFLEAKIKKILRKYSHSRAVRVINSKLGIIIIPAGADKDRGIEEFGKYLAKNFNHAVPPWRDTGAKNKSAAGGFNKKFAKNWREIAVVGDQPGKGGNDEMFLDGRVGTPFTAGKMLATKCPIGIFDKNGKQLFGPTATEHLLKSMEFC